MEGRERGTKKGNGNEMGRIRGTGRGRRKGRGIKMVLIASKNDILAIDNYWQPFDKQVRLKPTKVVFLMQK